MNRIDDEKEATELIKVGKLSLMSKEVKEKEFWVNTHVLQADEQLERMRKIARKVRIAVLLTLTVNIFF